MIARGGDMEGLWRLMERGGGDGERGRGWREGEVMERGGGDGERGK